MRTSVYPRRLHVWANGIEVGIWELSRGRTHTFQYLDSWVEREDASSLSASLPLPLSQMRFTGEKVENFFDNLLPDNPDIRRKIRERYHLGATSSSDLLSAIGKDCIGAIQLLEEGEPPHSPQQVEGRELSESQIAHLLRHVGGNGGFSNDEDEFRISLAGAQEKTALLFHEEKWKAPLGATATTHIFKLPLGEVGMMNADLSLSLENEWLCSHILSESGMDTAKCEILRFEEVKTLVVERFDRTWIDGALYRVPQEDFCQVTGTSPQNKYESDGGPGIENIMNILKGSSNSRGDRNMFFSSQIFFWLLTVPDGHAKNFSIFPEPHNLYRLTPLYDVISAYPVLGEKSGQTAAQKLNMAMAISGKNREYHWDRITVSHLRETAQRCGIDFENIAHKVSSRVSEALPRVQHQLPSDFPASVSDPIFAGVEKQLSRIQAGL